LQAAGRLINHISSMTFSMPSALKAQPKTASTLHPH
jgi:hypothetical protein